jgi:hypothetical protein
MALQSEELNIFQRVLGENVQIERELRGVLGVNLRSGRLAQASARLAQPGHIITVAADTLSAEANCL